MTIAINQLSATTTAVNLTTRSIRHLSVVELRACSRHLVMLREAVAHCLAEIEKQEQSAGVLKAARPADAEVCAN